VEDVRDEIKTFAATARDRKEGEEKIRQTKAIETLVAWIKKATDKGKHIKQVPAESLLRKHGLRRDKARK
jgi:hypothetical protein